MLICVYIYIHVLLYVSYIYMIFGGFGGVWKVWIDPKKQTF